ncbi:ATP-grasp domain-containing protein [Aetokthonos hydrillicola Thurmond2011]|uniref:ATP-grasp domain-containing protein n=1 Tax=Aetokthonos hydrillicola Thurmond2011 TaxID=2712845 RepID=A0AAP5MDN1_9CYAN|nr:ATP-grasp domain-containing protein [Aetokthonos hydrillicola]MBO3463233.1 ATP-grasp domain-containing protein [Aetokthonos hydrillicola CCALA 1050]MBW4590706.1 ATP-grasp domain-containing protein [Aetokthonos hydrillicola CCALA 1050]MDR9899838.1 ATP-grasp domain-containing protein [Aetokthonos hydrillicola Thurmond2011]
MAQSIAEFQTTTQPISLGLKVAAFFQSFATLILLLLTLPINATVVLLSILWTTLARPFHRREQAAHPKNILISGGKMTKALQLARSFHAAGHRVVLIETHKYWLSGHRFSQAVDKFYTTPVPEKDPDAYTQALIDIIKRESIDVYIPVTSPVASYYDSLAKPALSQYCEVFHVDADVCQMLDDKYAFSEKARQFGLSVPKSFEITSPEQVLNFDFSHETRKYILKSIPYDSVRRLDLTKLPCETPKETEAFVRSLPISPQKPWIMQEFIPGKEFCTHSTVRDGKLRLHTCCESSAFQVNYKNVENHKIRQWVTHFFRELKITGQISFDFIETEDGEVYAIECNPRIHSAITTFHDHPGVADAYLGDSQNENELPIQPLPDSKPTYWLYHEVWRLNEIRSWSQLQAWLEKIIQGTDALFQIDDPLPFLTVPHWQITLLLLENLRKLKSWIRIDFNIGKLVELGGD